MPEGLAVSKFHAGQAALQTVNDPGSGQHVQGFRVLLRHTAPQQVGR